MQELIKKEWNGFAIEFEQVNGQLMANATSMCAAYNKKPSHWLQLEKTKAYIKALEAKAGNPAPLYETRNGGADGGGTWISEKLILKLAQWLSVDFELQCDEWLAELLRTGTVTTGKPSQATQLQMLLAQVTQAVELERRQTELEAEVEVVKQDVQVLAHTIVNQVHQLNYFTLSGYYAKHSQPMPHNNVLKQLGKAAVKQSNASSVPVNQTKHEKYGFVKVYRDDILKQVLGF